MMIHIVMLVALMGKGIVCRTYIWEWLYGKK